MCRLDDRRQGRDLTLCTRATGPDLRNISVLKLNLLICRLDVYLRAGAVSSAGGDGTSRGGTFPEAISPSNETARCSKQESGI